MSRQRSAAIIRSRGVRRLRTARLERETSQVNQLNSELRIQIFEHSKTLTTALIRMQEGTGELHVEDIVGQRYRIVSPLGEGGMGQVFLLERNVMVEDRLGQAWVKVTGFGISSLGSEGSEQEVPAARPAVTPISHLTCTGIILGTAAYRAPELSLIGSRQANPPVDVFSFEVLAYEVAAR